MKRDPAGTWPPLYLPVSTPEARGLQVVRPRPYLSYRGAYSTYRECKQMPKLELLIRKEVSTILSIAAFLHCSTRRER